MVRFFLDKTQQELMGKLVSELEVMHRIIFLLATLGFNQEQIGYITDLSQPTVSRYLKDAAKIVNKQAQNSG
jgi:DNA-directed RNA polymerase specialized sigma24 family protein